MKILKPLFFLMLVTLLWSSVAATDEQGGKTAMPGPNAVSQAKFPITLGNGEYDLLTAILEFSPGSGFAEHFHGGHALATVVSGEMTLREKGGVRVIKAGESWTEAPGNIHSVVNAGTSAARVVVSFLLPKGAEMTTMVK